jgi:hypothetical protein
MEDMKAAIEALHRARDAKLAELHGIEQALAALGASVKGGAKGRSRTQDFQDLGVTAAAKRFLREMAPEPQDTRTIADAIVQRGLKTTSKNFIATVYATLNNSRAFRRTKDKKWELVE